MAAGAIRRYDATRVPREVGMFLYVRKSFMIFKIVLACIAFLAAIIALLGTSQNSLLLTQETGKQLGVVMALVFGIITIVEAFMVPPEAIISDKIISGWKNRARYAFANGRDAEERRIGRPPAFSGTNQQKMASGSGCPMEPGSPRRDGPARAGRQTQPGAGRRRTPALIFAKAKQPGSSRFAPGARQTITCLAIS